MRACINYILLYKILSYMIFWANFGGSIVAVATTALPIALLTRSLLLLPPPHLHLSLFVVIVNVCFFLSFHPKIPKTPR